MIHNHHRKRRPHCTEEEYEAPWNKLGLPDLMHVWVHENIEKAYELGLLVKSHDDPREVPITIPEEIVKTPRAKREKREKARNRRTVSLAVPKDEQEDGAGIFDDLLKECKKELDLATGGKSGDYNALVAVMYGWLKHQ